MSIYALLSNRIAVLLWKLRAVCSERCSKIFGALESDPRMSKTSAIKSSL